MVLMENRRCAASSRCEGSPACTRRSRNVSCASVRSSELCALGPPYVTTFNVKDVNIYLVNDSNFQATTHLANNGT